MVEPPRQFPPVVYAPITELPDDPGTPRLKMHTMADGRTAVFVYSALDRLVDLYGADAPWMLLGVEALQRAYDQAPYDLVLLDRELHPTPTAGVR
jgi:hypothetical protein